MLCGTTKVKNAIIPLQFVYDKITKQNPCLSQQQWFHTNARINNKKCLRLQSVMTLGKHPQGLSQKSDYKRWAAQQTDLPVSKQP